MSGHVFIVQGDLRRLACDAWLMPCDRRARPEDKWLLPDRSAPRWPEPPAAWREGRLRVLPVEDGPADEPRPWLGNMDGGPDTPATWYVEGARQFLAEARRALHDRPFRLERPHPLLALPLVGTGEGGGKEQAGEIVAALLELLHDEVRGDGPDVALVAHDGPAYAAAQSMRERQGEARGWPALDAGLRERASDLARRATRGELALFLGAGVSASAGLPLWGELIQVLAGRAGLTEPERQALRRLNLLDQASVLEKRLGGPDQMRQAVRAVYTRDRHGLTHALLAGLPVREVVTTNYDQLFEMAWAFLGRDASILPYAIRPGATRWLLKLHGCISHPEDIVLTRSHLLGQGRQLGALSGIVETLLITRHMLFVGFSLRDDDFHTIADAVRRTRDKSCPTGDEREPFGTVLALERNPLVEELWDADLGWVGMSDPDADTDHDERRRAAAWRLEVFLDYLLARTRDTAYLLDDRYQAVLDDGERELREGLLGLEHGLSPAARAAQAWHAVRDLLAGLGWQPPEPEER